MVLAEQCEDVGLESDLKGTMEMGNGLCYCSVCCWLLVRCSRVLGLFGSFDWMRPHKSR